MEGMTGEGRIADLEAENAAPREQVQELPLLRGQVALLVGRVQELKARLAKEEYQHDFCTHHR
jgi:hypothetical protein